MKELELLKLQLSFKNSDIYEEDIPLENKKDLIRLYKIQNKELKEQIELELKNIKEKLEEIN